MNQPELEVHAGVRRAVVTGIGAVTPLGTGVDKLWNNLLAGGSGIRLIRSFDTSGHPVRIAGEVPDWVDASATFFAPAERKKLDPGTQMAIVAAIEAINSSRIFAPVLGDRLAVVFGTGVGGLQATLEQHTVLSSRGPRRVSPHLVSKIIPNSAAGHIAIHFGARGPVSSVSTACASGANAVADALALIRQGRVDAVICGGTEAVVTPLAMAGFAQMRGLSTRNEEPERASRPFDRDRDGFVLSEGAGALVVESLEHARARDAPVLAELVGAGLACDAYHIAAPRPDSGGIRSAVEWCLRDAGLQPEAVGYINAHATGTPAGDVCELRALEAVFGDTSRPPLVSSVKGQLGHLLGAAGAVEAVITTMAIHNHLAPACTNCDSPEETPLELVRQQAKPLDRHVALSTSFGFGGHNACLAFAKFPPL